MAGTGTGEFLGGTTLDLVVVYPMRMHNYGVARSQAFLRGRVPYSRLNSSPMKSLGRRCGNIVIGLLQDVVHQYNDEAAQVVEQSPLSSILLSFRNVVLNCLFRFSEWGLFNNRAVVGPQWKEIV